MSYQTNVSPEEAVGKARALQMHKMSANENPFGPSPEAVKAIQETSLKLGPYPPRSDQQLKEAILAAVAPTLKLENVVSGNGGCDVIGLLARAYLNPDSAYLLCPPTFPVYQLMGDKQNARAISVPLDREDFSYRLDAIQAALTADTRVLYVCNANNPTGTSFGQEDFEALLEIIPDEVLIVYDEVYYHFATTPMPDAVAAVEAGSNILVLHSFSKAYGLAGLRLGYGLAPAEVVAKLEAVKNPFHVNHLALAAGEAALTDQEHVNKTVENNTRGRSLISSNLKTLGLKVWDSQTNFVLFELPPDLEVDAVVQALQNGGVMVRSAFGLDRHIRVTVALPAANQRFIELMTELVKRSR